MLKKIWLRDYNLPLMHERIKRQLTRGIDPDDCVVNITEVERYIKEVFNEFEKDVCLLPVNQRNNGNRFWVKYMKFKQKVDTNVKH